MVEIEVSPGILWSYERRGRDSADLTIYDQDGHAVYRTLGRSLEESLCQALHWYHQARGDLDRIAEIVTRE